MENLADLIDLGIKKSKNVLGVLRRLGVFTNGVHPARSIRLYKSLVQSRMGVLPAPDTVDKQGRG